MRLSLRLIAERSDRPGILGEYLDDPLLLFVPVRFLIGVVGVVWDAEGRLLLARHSYLPPPGWSLPLGPGTED